MIGRHFQKTLAADGFDGHIHGLGLVPGKIGRKFSAAAEGRLNLYGATPVPDLIIAMPHRGNAELLLEEVDDLLAQKKPGLRFPDNLERIFQEEILEERIKQFHKISLVALIVYNSYIFVDWLIMPDIFFLVCLVQLAVVTPLMVGFINLYIRRIIRPEPAVTICVLLTTVSILLFFSLSKTVYSSYIIFTIPVALVFGSAILPLPFKWSAWFSGIVVLASVAALFVRRDVEVALATFAVLVIVNVGAYMLMATYRMEATERRNYLFNLREKLRAETLTAKNRILQSLSETDPLTGVANRRCFDAKLERMHAMASEDDTFLSLLLIDVDHFKSLNDTFGHQAGDGVLQVLARCLQQHSFPDAVVARYGGEEFAVLLPGASPIYALSCAEVLRAAVERLADTKAGKDVMPASLTVSIGVATSIPVPGTDGFHLLKAADQALYRAKANGRNRVASSVPENERDELSTVPARTSAM